MKLIAMVQVSGVDEEEEAIIAKLLTVSILTLQHPVGDPGFSERY